MSFVLAFSLACFPAVVQLRAQTQPAPVPANPPDAAEPAPTGKVLFSRDANSPGAQPTVSPNPAAPTSAPTQSGPLAVTDAERSALTFTAYDLDVHLTPASAAISVRAGLTLRNDSPAPLTRLILQISSSLHWDALSTRSLPNGPTTPLPFAARLIDTDADHTGRMTEAVVTLPHPLAPGASLSLIALYSGAIPPSAERLTRIGAPGDQALAADWDSISPSLTALRGFGNVLWLPASAPPVFLGDGAQVSSSPSAAPACATPPQPSASVSPSSTRATRPTPPSSAASASRSPPSATTPTCPRPSLPASPPPLFDAQPLGFRSPSLFVTDRPPSQTGTPANPDPHRRRHRSLRRASRLRRRRRPGRAPPHRLARPAAAHLPRLLDHPGQPFEDDALLVRPMRAAEPATLAPALAHSLTHVWIHSTHPWIDEGLAQFLSLLWTERTAGRAAALAELQDAARPLALAEPEVPADSSGCPIHDGSIVMGGVGPGTSPECASVSPAGSSLVSATGDIFYRTKAAAVWWMLRSIVGDDALKQALQTYRLDAARLDRDPAGLQRTLEKSSHKDLRWFFDDWVYRDRGLPDLSIVSVTPSQLTSRAGLPAGWLIAVEVRNDGYAAAEVPVTVRSSTASETQRLRIPGRSSASTRIVFAGTPAEVQVNDGGVPETQSSLHTRQLLLPSH